MTCACGAPAVCNGFCNDCHPGFTSLEVLAILNDTPFPEGSQWAKEPEPGETR